MKRFVPSLLLTMAISAPAAQSSQGLKRIPLQRTASVMQTPVTYQMGERWDTATGRMVTYDPKPRVIDIDARRGTVHLRWIGMDGKQKTVTYHRPDAVDVIVSADVTPAQATLLYAYDARVLPSSGRDLRGFVVQSLGAPVTQERQPGVLALKAQARFFETGDWWAFALLPDFAYRPGQAVRFRMQSLGPPGLVRCCVHAALGYVGAGEEMPQELAAQLPGYEAWPSGYTIGPDERLRVLSPAQRAAKLVEWLPEFERQGWMTPERRRHYETAARRGDMKGLAGLVDTDLRAERITTEVRAIVLGLADLLGKR